MVRFDKDPITIFGVLDKKFVFENGFDIIYKSKCLKFLVINYCSFPAKQTSLHTLLEQVNAISQVQSKLFKSLPNFR